MILILNRLLCFMIIFYVIFICYENILCETGRSIDINNLNTSECAVEVISPPTDSIWSTKTCDKEILTG